VFPFKQNAEAVYSRNKHCKRKVHPVIERGSTVPLASIGQLVPIATIKCCCDNVIIPMNKADSLDKILLVVSLFSGVQALQSEKDQSYSC
jgi:hypothetical protein